MIAIDNDEWSANLDGVVSVNWDGILDEFDLEDGATVQLSYVSALIELLVECWTR